MNLPLRFTHAAEVDYYESLAWYEQKQAGLGVEFEEVIDRCLRQVAEKPEVFAQTRILVEGHFLRRFVVHRFPFVIFYITTQHELVVIAIFHTSRDLGLIEGRKLS